MLNLLNKEQRNVLTKLSRCESCIKNLQTEVCKCYDSNNFKRCNSLLSRIKVLEIYRVSLRKAE